MTEPREPMDRLPVGAIVASALMAAHISCDSGEDVDRFLEELAGRGVRLGPSAPDPDEYPMSVRALIRELNACPPEFKATGPSGSAYGAKTFSGWSVPDWLMQRVRAALASEQPGRVAGDETDG